MLVAFSIKLDRIDEELLYQDKGGGWWLSAICTLEQDAKGRWSSRRVSPGNATPQGREAHRWVTGARIGAKDKPPSREGGGFNLARYKATATAHKPAPSAAKYPDGQEGLSPQAAFDAAQKATTGAAGRRTT